MSSCSSFLLCYFTRLKCAGIMTTRLPLRRTGIATTRRGGPPLGRLE
jgi:hypothetical protein